MNDIIKRSYLQRLFTPYHKKNGELTCYLLQYVSGDGNELKEKFWAPHSSSRMAFELYSGLNGTVQELQFEFQLPGLSSGGKGPNMDVFIETNHEIIFIESKYSEKANLHYIDNGYLSKAYYDKAPYGKHKMNLCSRYANNEWGEKFAEFCTEWEKEMEKNKWHKGCDWFEPKQETCHMSGILLWLFNSVNQDRIRGKHICLYNVYWRIGEIDGNPEMPQRFEDMANKYLREIIKESKKDIGIKDFEIGYYTVQDVLQTPELLSPEIHSLGSDVNERIEEFRKLAQGQTRKSFKAK